MAKYLVETYYTCSFKVSHYLDDINEENLNNLEKNDDGKFEIIDIKLDNRKTKNLQDTKSGKIEMVSQPITGQEVNNSHKSKPIDENLPELHLNISNILQVKNDMDKAKDHLFKALKLRNDFSKADQNLSMLLNYKDNIN